MTLSDHDLRELLRDDRPAPDPRFTAALDERVRTRFASNVDAAPRRSRQRRLRLVLLPALGVAATLLVALVVVLPALTDPGAPVGAGAGPASEGSASSDLAAGGGSTGTDAQVPSDLAPEVAAGRSVPSPPLAATAPLPADPGAVRRVERSASLTLAPPSDDLERVGDGVVRATDRVGGFVQSSSVRAGDDETGGGLFTLRVPTAKLETLLAELSRLTHVRDREQAVEDVTATFDTARDRLEQARAERRSLLRRLERSESDVETRRLRARLVRAGRRIEARERSLNAVRSRTALATVTVVLVAEGDGGAGFGSPGDGRWGLDDAVADALRLLEGLAGILIVLTVLALPIAPFVLLAHAVRRRGRERALDLA